MLHTDIHTYRQTYMTKQDVEELSLLKIPMAIISNIIYMSLFGNQKNVSGTYFKPSMKMKITFF